MFPLVMGIERRETLGATIQAEISPRLARPLKSTKLFPDSLRKIDEDELILIEQVILSAFVDHPHEVVFRCSCIGYHSIDLANDQRGLISPVLKTQRELLRQALHDRALFAETLEP